MRIISLCPSITQLVFDLGRGEDLVGITKWCIHPAEKVAEIEKVGGTKDPKLDRIQELQPDVVLFNREENRREDWEAINAAGLFSNVTHPQDVDGAIAAVQSIGAALEREAEATRIVEDIRAARAEVAELGVGVPRWAYLIWRKPWMAVNGNNYISNLITEVGGRNVFADHEKIYPEVSAQDLKAANPELVFLSSEPFPFKQKHIDELSEATGLSTDRFRLVDGELLSWHGCYTAAGLRYAGKILFSQQTREQDPD